MIRMMLAALVALAIALCVTAAEAAPSVTAIEKALVALNGRALAGDQPRARTIAAAIESASLEAVCAPPWADSDFCQVVWPGTRTELAAALIVQGTLESGFAENVGAGRCRPKQCDSIKLPGGRVVHLARHYWQLHASPTLLPLLEWATLRGVEYHPTADAAYAAARVLGAGYRGCRTLEGGIAAYARGSGCQWGGAARRVRLIRTVEARLR
jgi:hypothetical protein